VSRSSVTSRSVTWSELWPISPQQERRGLPDAYVFVTVDRNLPYQQHFPKYDIAVILLRAKSNRIADLITLAPELIAALPTAKKGVVTPIGL
jgi:hypothetical protein